MNQMLQKPAVMSAIGKARRRSSLLHPLKPKSPRNATARVSKIKPPQLHAPLPPSSTVGRVTTIGVRGCPALSRAPVASTHSLARSSMPRQTINARQSDFTVSRVRSQAAAPSVSKASSTATPAQRVPRRPGTAPPVSYPHSKPTLANRNGSRQVAAQHPTEAALLKEKLSDVEQKVKEKESQNQLQEQMITMLNENLATVKRELQKVKMERDVLEMERARNIENVSALENELEDEKKKVGVLVSQIDEKDVVLRKLHNDVVDLRGQIRVAIRVRPMLKAEEAVSSAVAIEYPAVNAISILQGSKPSGQQFEFEKVFTPAYSQDAVFLNIEDFIMSALHGYNVGLIAFGQTGSGKTHTMRGGDAEQEGVIPRAGAFLFNESKKMEATGWNFDFSLSFIEIYNNEAYDLLNNHQVVKLQIVSQDLSMKGLSTHPISKLSDMGELLQRADRNRKTAATKSNEYSSRSHAIYMWNITAHQPSTGISTTSVLKLVDLAGSERAKESGATGQQFMEMTAINQSLSVLQKCVSLQKAKSKHVPYREAKLTQVLMDCLGRGNSKTMVIVNINPCSEQAQESRRSIEFASRMRDTHIGAAVQQQGT